MNELAVRYTANDGQEVALDRESVNRFILSGSAKATDAEIAGFLAICKARGLNPLARDAYLVKYGESNPASVIVSKDYYNRTAQQQQGFDGFDAGVVVAKPDGSIEYRDGALVGAKETLVGGWCKVYDKRRSHPVTNVVSMDEYDQHRSLWKTKPATMIRKVAFVQSMREAYPSAFQGLYDESEMPEAPRQIPVQAIEEQPSRAEEAPRQAALDKGRGDALRRFAARWASISGCSEQEAKRAIMAMGDPRGMDDAAWAGHVARIESELALMASERDAAESAAQAEYASDADAAQEAYEYYMATEGE